MVNNLLFIILLMNYSTILDAATPLAKKWAQNEFDERNLDTVVFASTLEVNRKPKFLDLRSPKDHKGTLIKILSNRTAELAIKFNSYKKPTEDPAINHAKEIAKLLNANYVVHSDGKLWDIYYVKTQMPLKIGSIAQPEDVSFASLTNWLFKALNYKGAVLARKGEYLLVATIGEELKSGLQAIAVADSQKKILLRENDLTRGSIIELTNSSSNFSVFRTILGPKNLTKGTKIQYP